MRLKKLVSADLKRAQPNSSARSIFISDASESGIDAILSQKSEAGKERMTSAYSKTLEPAQRNHATTDKKLLAIVKSMEYYRHSLLGKEFLLRTDKKALTYLHTCKPPSTRMLIWAIKLQEIQFKIQYVRGEENVADSSSKKKQHTIQ